MRMTTCALAGASLIAWGGASVAADLVSKSANVDAVRHVIVQIKSEPAAEARERLARRLVNDLQKTNVSDVDDSTMSEIISLLDDTSDGVRARAATALALFGPRAVTAIPSLEKAFEHAIIRIEDVQQQNFNVSGLEIFTGQTSAHEICYAFQQIGHGAPQSCMDGYYIPGLPK